MYGGDLHWSYVDTDIMKANLNSLAKWYASYSFSVVVALVLKQVAELEQALAVMGAPNRGPMDYGPPIPTKPSTSAGAVKR